MGGMKFLLVRPLVVDSVTLELYGKVGDVVLGMLARSRRACRPPWARNHRANDVPLSIPPNDVVRIVLPS